MLACAESILDTDCEGYKGGQFTMHGHVIANIGKWGVSGEEIGKHHFLYWSTFLTTNR